MARRDDISAGLLAYRRRNQIEVLLAHPGGPYWARKDDGAWTIPKGLVRPDDLTRVNIAFFNINALISIGLLVVGTIDLLT